MSRACLKRSFSSIDGCSRPFRACFLMVDLSFFAATVTYANSNESLVRKPRLLVCPNWNDSAEQLGVSPGIIIVTKPMTVKAVRWNEV